MVNRYLFTSESVTEGHPDKICDQISDAILDAILVQDPKGRVAAECSASTGLVLLFGEITTTAQIQFQDLVRNVIAQIGYVGEKGGGFDAHSCSILSAINKQSPDIASGVSQSLETRDSESSVNDLGAGDQGMMFGFACNETPELMPMPVSLAHQMARRLTEKRKDGTLKYLRPDGKTQVTIEYVNGKPVRVDAIVISTQHDPAIDGVDDNQIVQARIAKDLKTHVIDPCFTNLSIKPDAETRYLINPSGRFVVGGPHGDSGLTGRKIIVDTYGGYSRHGGGAFSGKDATKVDRSAAYMARYVAKNIVAAGLADRVEVQLAYAIGVAEPVSVLVDTFGTGKVADDVLENLVRKNFSLTPKGIMETLDLRKPIFKATAAYGHFGREGEGFSWEKTDKADALAEQSGVNAELAAK